MRIWKFPDQVVRLGILFAAAVAALLLIRSNFVPASFGEVGHYRAEAVQAVASEEIKYGGSQLCVECHDGEGEVKDASYHRRLSCEVCHGPAYDHAEDPDTFRPRVPRERGAVCLYCHGYLTSRPTGFPQIIERLHNPMEPCVACHDPHDPRPPSVPESCAACHAQIARTKAVSPHASLSCETCHEAMSEHRETPRSFLPKKPQTREFCVRCHGEGADGAQRAPRIETSTHGGKYLCWQCHYPHFPEG